jgi:OmpA-OmpF porin, OOP family
VQASIWSARGLGRAVALTAAVLTIGQASAKDTGFYVGIGVGQSNYDFEKTDPGIADVPVRSETDGSDAIGTVVAGYRVNRYLAVEASYNDLGQATFQETGGLFPVVSDGRVSVKGSAVALALTLPLAKWEFYGKVGALFAEADYSVSTTFFNPLPLPSPAAVRSSVNSIEPLFAVGVGYSFASHYLFKLDFTSVANLAERGRVPVDIQLLSAGFQYRF